MTQVLDRINALLDAGSNLVHLSGLNREHILDEFKDFNTFTAKAVYHWQEGHELYRLDVPHIRIPNTTTLSQVLNHIEHTHHFGIYLLEGYGRQLEEPNVARELIKLNHAEMRERHVIVLLDAELHPHAQLVGQIVRRQWQ